MRMSTMYQPAARSRPPKIRHRLLYCSTGYLGNDRRSSIAIPCDTCLLCRIETVVYTLLLGPSSTS